MKTTSAASAAARVSASEVLESFVTKRRDKKVALKILRKAMEKHGQAEVLVTDKLRSYGAALKDLGVADRQETEKGG